MNFSSKPNHARSVLTVSELNYNAKILLEQAMPLLWVNGEVSNLKCYSSGHWYFSLKDANAQIRCVMFRHRNQYLDWQPTDGMQIEVRALVTLYEPRGDFQLSVETIRRAGLGSLFAAFEKLKAKLQKAGLFDPAHKKTPPINPKQIGVITSPSAAALRDVLATLKHRMPALPVIIYPTQVQGDGAAEKIADAIHLAKKRAECDVLILCRGGGSIEDLWEFNEEIVAHAIASCPIPIICGVGHETDFTISDFVADVRAPTPTGAAQLACQDAQVLLHHLDLLYGKIRQAMLRGIERLMQNIDMLTHRLLHPGDRIHQQLLQLKNLYERLSSSWSHQIDTHFWKLSEINHRLSAARPDLSRLIKQQNEMVHRLNRAMIHRTEKLETDFLRLQTHLLHLNPQAVLARGYSLSYTADGTLLRDSKQIEAGGQIRVKFTKGWCDASVLKKNK